MSGSNRAWMPLSIDDYMADTGHLTVEEHGAYLMLIMRYWKKGGLPDDDRLVQRYAMMSDDQWVKSRDILLAFFYDGWRHKRIDAELSKADEIIEKRRKAAYSMHDKRTMDASAVHVHSKSSDTRVPPRTYNQEIEKEEPNGSSKKRGCRIPVDFVPDQEWAIANGMSQPQAISEAANFCDYWTAKAGAAATKLDWPATWRTWVRNSVQRAPVARGSPAVQKRMTVADAAAQLHREMKIAEQRPDPDSGTDRPLAIGFYSEREH